MALEHKQFPFSSSTKLQITSLKGHHSFITYLSRFDLTVLSTDLKCVVIQIYCVTSTYSWVMVRLVQIALTFIGAFDYLNILDVLQSHLDK